MSSLQYSNFSKTSEKEDLILSQKNSVAQLFERIEQRDPELNGIVLKENIVRIYLSPEEIETDPPEDVWYIVTKKGNEVEFNEPHSVLLEKYREFLSEKDIEYLMNPPDYVCESDPAFVNNDPDSDSD